MSRIIPMPEWKGSKFCILGDSIDYNDTAYSSLAVFNSGGSIVKNASVGGKRIDELSVIFDTEIANQEFDYLIFKGGTNDAIQRTTLSTSLSSIESIKSKCYALGKGLIVVLPPPCDFDATAREGVQALRDSISFFCIKNGVPCIDAFAQFVEPTTGGWITGATTGDGIHPSQTTDNTASVVLKDYIATLGLAKSLKPVSPLVGAGLVLDPIFTKTGSTTRPDIFIGGTPLGTETLTTDSDFKGKCYRLVSNSAPSNKTTVFEFATGTFSNHKILFRMKLKSGSTSGQSFILMLVGLNASDETITQKIIVKESALGGYMADLCENITMGDLVTKIRSFMYSYPTGGANMVCDIKIGEVQLYDLTALGLT